MEKGKYRDPVLMAAASFILYLIPIGNLFFVFPLLLLSKRYPKRTTDTACVAVLVLVLSRMLWLYRASLGDALTWAFIAVSLFVPASLISGAVIWVHRKRNELVWDLLLTIVPSLVMFFAIEVWFLLSPETAGAVYSSFESVYAAVVGDIFSSMGASFSDVFYILLILVLSLTAGSILLNLALIIFFFEAGAHHYSADFDLRTSLFRVPEGFIYAFLGLWALMLLKRFVTFPPSVSLIVNNLAVVSAVVYAMQGYAIVYFNLRKRGMRMRSTRFFGLVFMIMLLLPGVNVLLTFALPILGVCENWVVLRKLEEGVFKDENYS